MRAAKGLRKEDLGKALKVSRQTINAIETGRFRPSLQLAITLARVLRQAGGRTVLWRHPGTSDDGVRCSPGIVDR